MCKFYMGIIRYLMVIKYLIMKKTETNFFLYGSVLSVNLLSFCAGSGYSWTSPVLPKLNSNNSAVNPLSTATTIVEDSWITSLYTLGAVFGPFIAGPITNRLGRKKTLLNFGVCFLVSHLLFAFGTHVNVFLAARLIQGIGIGCVFSVLPGYVGEISEDYNRGTVSGIMGIVVGVGSLFNYLVGPFVSVRILSFLNIIPVILFFVSFGIFVPESPYYYISKNDAARAENSLNKLRKKSVTAIKKELIYITKCVQEDINNKGSFIHLFQSRALIRGLVVSSGVMLMQQFSGICAIIGYMQTIFEVSGTTIPSHISVIVIGVVQVTVITCTTYLADILGRKILLLLSTTGTCISLTSLGTYFYLKDNEFNVDAIFWLPLSSLIVFIIAYDLGLGSLPWTIMGELFSPNVKSMASSITSVICLMAAFFIMKFFPYLAIALGMAGSFWVFAGLCGVAVLFTVFIVPETKGRSLLEIQLLLSR